MSRFRRVVHGLVSSYAILIVSALYSIATAPLALHYLSQERFSLWILMGSISTYLNLIDLGMSGSVARLLIDHKDERAVGAYGGLIKTGWLVLVVQASILMAIGYVFAPLAVGIYRIDPALQSDFVSLIRWQTTGLGLGLAMRISNHLLYAHQRQDVMGYLQIGTLALNFVLLWVFFHLGHGVFSLAWASLVSTIFGALVALVIAGQMKLFPTVGAWGRASWHSFLEIFGFGKDLFLYTVGSQLITASQTMIISRTLGPLAVVAWGIGTKAFTLIAVMASRIADMAGPAISEMIVRHEHALLRERHQTLVILTGSFSALAAVSYALCNSTFVTVWMHGQIAWPSHNDILLGAWMIVLAILKCHAGLIVLSKQIGFMRYVFFVEGLVFVATSLLVARHGGLPSVILCSLFCSIAFSGAYTVWRVSHFFDLPIRVVAFQWNAPMVRLLLFLVPIGLVAGWSFRLIEPPVLRLAVMVFLCSTLCLYLFLRYGLTRTIKRELLTRSPKPINSILNRVFSNASL